MIATSSSKDIKLDMEFTTIVNYKFNIIVPKITVSEKSKFEYRMELIEKRNENLENLIKKQNEEIKELKLLRKKDFEKYEQSIEEINRKIQETSQRNEKARIEFNAKIKNEIENIKQKIIKFDEIIVQKDKKNAQYIQEIEQKINEITSIVEDFKKKKYVEWGEVENDECGSFFGQIANGSPKGFGTLYDKFGDKYIGYIEDWIPSGHMNVFLSKETIKDDKDDGNLNPLLALSGNFMEGRLYGLSTFYFENGEIKTYHAYGYEKYYPLEEQGQAQAQVLRTKRAQKILYKDVLQEIDLDLDFKI